MIAGFRFHQASLVSPLLFYALTTLLGQKAEIEHLANHATLTLPIPCPLAQFIATAVEQEEACE